MSLFSKRQRRSRPKKPPRIRVPRQTPEQLRLATPQPWRPRELPLFDPYPDVAHDPLGDLARAELRYANEQASAGRELLRSERGIETAADEQNMRAATNENGAFTRLDADCEPIGAGWQPSPSVWGDRLSDLGPQVDIGPYLAEPLTEFGGVFPQPIPQIPMQEPMAQVQDQPNPLPIPEPPQGGQ